MGSSWHQCGPTHISIKVNRHTLVKIQFVPSEDLLWVVISV